MVVRFLEAPLDERVVNSEDPHHPPTSAQLPDRAMVGRNTSETQTSSSAQSRIPDLSINQLRSWRGSFTRTPMNRLAISSFSDNPIDKILISQSAVRTDQQIFNVKIPLEGFPITNQYSSGRCWLFASTNVFRIAFMKEHDLAEFELSQAYLFYWDKIEKANYFLEKIIETADQELSGRLVQKLLSDPVSDGGQWDMVANLVNKYGLVPKALYPDNYHAKNSSRMNWLVTVKLREQALVLRRLARSPNLSHLLAHVKEQFMQEIHDIVTTLLGPPPDPEENFVWTYSDTKGHAHQLSTSPREFAERVSTRLFGGSLDHRQMLSLVNDPRNEYNRLLTVDKLGIIVGGRPITYINVDMDTIKSAVIATLRAGHPVFFGCDVGKFYSSSHGIMDTELFDISLGFNITLEMDKAERLETGESSMTHAMILTGVHIEGIRPVRWRVQNSWGSGAGDHGFFVMTDAWMDEYLYQVVVDPQFVSKETRDILTQEPKVLPRWDPLGVLA